MLLLHTRYLLWFLLGAVRVLAQPDPPDPPEEPGVCIACYGGGVPASTTLCDELVAEAAEVDGFSDDCTIIQMIAASECGPECLDPPTPEGNCTVCADGVPVGNPNEPLPIIDGIYYETCSVYDEFFLRGLAPWLCEEWKQRAGAWCGCPGVENECPLCPEADLNKPFPCLPPCVPFHLGRPSAVTCRDAAFFLSTLRSWECMDLFSDFAPFSYCGCDVPPPNVCEVCSGNQVLADPGFFVTSHQATCGEIQEIASYIYPGYYCNLVRDAASAACECVDATATSPPSTRAPETLPPSTEVPQTPPPSTEAPQTPEPSTLEPTPEPSTEVPQTTPPSTEAPQIPEPTTPEPTPEPSTEVPQTLPPSTGSPQTSAPTPGATDRIDPEDTSTPLTISVLSHVIGLVVVLKLVV